MGKFLGLFCIISVPFACVHADIELDQLSYAGTGCPGDGQPVSLFKSGKRLVVYTPDMNVDLSGSSFDRKTCNFALPVKVGANERVVVGRPSVFGRESLREHGALKASSEVFFTGAGNGPSAGVQVAGSDKKNSDFYERSEDSIASACGQDTIVRAQTTALATGRDAGSAKVRGLAFDLKLEQCEAN